MKIGSLVGVVALLLAVSLASAKSEPACKPLQRIAKLPMGTDAAGGVTVPMSFDGKPVDMIIDTAGIFSMLTGESATRLGLESRKIVGSARDYIGMPDHVITQMYGGSLVDHYAVAHDVTLGAMRADRREFYIFPEGTLIAPEVGGSLAPDILRAFDLDFDFANATFSLFSQDHCEGHVIYWTGDPAARVAITIDKYGHIVVPVQLDGKVVLAGVDTGSSNSVMSWEGAQHLFHLDEKTPGIKAGESGFHFPFKSLVMQDLALNNPDILMVPDARSHFGHDAMRLVLGMSALRQLHLYIAYKEGALYVTPASAH